MKKKSSSLLSRPVDVNGDIGITKKEYKPKGSLTERVRDAISSFSFDGEAFAKALVCGALLVVFALFQTTVFAKFRPFGAVPDLILPLVCAVAMSEKEKWGAIFGIIAAFVIESLGGSTFTILPLLYMPVGYVCGILAVNYMRDSIAVRSIFVVGSSLLRAVFTLFIVLATVGGITFVSALTKAVLPELLCNVLFGLAPHYITKLCLRPFNKTREEKVQ